MSAILSTENLSVALGGKNVLNGVTLDLRPGALIGLIGPNGAGKSTLLRALARLIAPSQGIIRLNGHNIAGMDQGELARNFAYLPQGQVVYWSLTVNEVVGLGRLPHRGRFASASAHDRRAIRDAMAKADILSFADRSIASLSGGERSRVMLARALAVEAPVLLADEPVASLDPYHQLQVMALLRDMARAGALILVVLHELPLAARFCDQLILLDRGNLAASGDSESVLSARNLARVYGVHGLHGRQDEEAFVLAWRRLEAGGDAQA